MLIVADTSALVALAACQQLHLLEVLFADIRVPPAVHRECTVPGKPGADALGEYLRGKVAEVVLSEFVIAVTGLGQGELEAMALYRKLSADELLVDDQRARKVARFNGMRVIGSVGVLLAAREPGSPPGSAAVAGGHPAFRNPHQRCVGRGSTPARGRDLSHSRRCRSFLARWEKHSQTCNNRRPWRPSATPLSAQRPSRCLRSGRQEAVGTPSTTSILSRSALLRGGRCGCPCPVRMCLPVAIARRGA